MTDDAEENRTRDVKGASTSDHKTRKTNPVHKPTKEDSTQDTTNTGLWSGREFGAVCCACSTKIKEKIKEYKQTNKQKFQYPECNLTMYANLCYEVYHIKLNFWEL